MTSWLDDLERKHEAASLTARGLTRNEVSRLLRIARAAERLSMVLLIPHQSKPEIGVPCCEEHEALIRALEDE